jgi:hypothetical protein
MAMIVEYLDDLRLHKKRRRYLDAPATPLHTLPAEWRSLLTQWLRLGGNSRWQTLIKKAGLTQKQTAEALLDWLLMHAWAVVDEERKHGDWWPTRLSLRAHKEMRAQLGLPDEEHQLAEWHTLRDQLQVAAENQPVMLAVISALESMPVARAVTRAQLISALLNWQVLGRSGTYRDFSLHARQSTKALSAAEWAWLETYFDLAVWHIEQHTPLLYVSASLCLQTPRGAIDLQAMPDFAALTPETLNSIQTVQGHISRWLLVENRTSFERVARARQMDEGVIWLPGFPPGWWKVAVAQLLQHAPAAASIAADPDPAGIQIAQQVINLWQRHGWSAQPWRMHAADVQACKQQIPLTTLDQEQLQGLLQQADLHPDLLALAETLLQCGYKVEQEAFL